MPKSGYAALGCLAAGLLAVLYILNPAETAIYLPCPFLWLTGLYCPGCGSLRSIHCLLNGNISAALSLNPLMVVSIPVLGLMLFNPRWMYKPWVPWTAFAILLGYGILRNIPAWPFYLLAP